jgi:hypothetical protein
MTSVIDCGGYGSNFDMILSPRVMFWSLTTSIGFIWAGGLQRRGGGGERAAAMMMKLRWQLGFMFGQNWCMGDMVDVHPSLYRGVGGVRED